MNKPTIPVFTLSDLGSTSGRGFEVLALEQVFTTPERDVLAAHRHDHYTVFWITEGQGTVTVDFTSYEIRPNLLCCLWPGQVHAWDVVDPPKGAFLSFTKAYYAGQSAAASEVAEMPLLYSVGGDAPVMPVSIEQASGINDVFQVLFRESHAALSDSEDMLRSYLRVFLLLARRIQTTQSGVSHPQEAGLALAKHFTQLVDTHFLTTSSVADYAQMLNVTTNHLVATLTRVMGKPAGHFIRERLVLEAKRLLRHSDLSISEVAYHLKFEDPSYFSRFFKKHTEFTPAQFRGV